MLPWACTGRDYHVVAERHDDKHICYMFVVTVLDKLHVP